MSNPLIGSLPILAAALLACAAMAQDAPNPVPAPRVPAAQSAPFDPAPVPSAYVAKQAADQWLASDFIGKDVYGPDREKVGMIDDLLFGKSGAIVAAVVGVGGFLGVGEKQVAVPFAELQFSTQGGKRVITMNATREALKSAPRFDKSESSG